MPRRKSLRSQLYRAARDLGPAVLKAAEKAETDRLEAILREIGLNDAGLA